MKGESVCERECPRESVCASEWRVCVVCGVYSLRLIHQPVAGNTSGDSKRLPCLHLRGVDTADYTYSTVPRRCGGSHTLTYPYRRNRPQHLSPLEEIQIAMKV